MGGDLLRAIYDYGVNPPSYMPELRSGLETVRPAEITSEMLETEHGVNAVVQGFVHNPQFREKVRLGVEQAMRAGSEQEIIEARPVVDETSRSIAALRAVIKANKGNQSRRAIPVRQISGSSDSMRITRPTIPRPNRRPVGNPTSLVRETLPGRLSFDISARVQNKMAVAGLCAVAAFGIDSYSGTSSQIDDSRSASRIEAEMDNINMPLQGIGLKVSSYGSTE